METLQWIVIAVLGVTFLGDIVLHFVLPSRMRKDYAETELAEHDADKEEIARLTKENRDLRVENEYLRMWICKRTDCQDPRGGRPPRDKLKDLKYEPPQRVPKE